MITSFSIKNFKAFKSLDNLYLRPLTVISGKNSCGKSTIMQSLLLLKQTVHGELEKQALILDGIYLQYSNLKEIAFGLPIEQSASIEYDINIQSKNDKGVIRFEIRHKTLPNQKEFKGPVVNKFQWSMNEGKLNTIQLRKGKYLWPHSAPFENRIPPTLVPVGDKIVEFEHFLPKFIEQNAKSNKEQIRLALPVEFASKDLGQLISTLNSEIKKMRYLGPSRAFPRRAYVHYSDKHYDLDEDGSNAAHIYWLKRKDKVWWKGKRVDLQSAVLSCLEIMGLRQKIYPKQSRNIIYQLEVETLSNHNKKVTIADVGFGYSQLLPIILRGLLSDRDSLILFEQPEIHLHPSCQARLADLFLAFNEAGKRIVVETHSTDLISRLRYLVIQEPSKSSEVNIVFVEPPDPDSGDGSIIKQLNLQADGMLDEWPEGFCDESENLARAILEARIKRSLEDA